MPLWHTAALLFFFASACLNVAADEEEARQTATAFWLKKARVGTRSTVSMDVERTTASGYVFTPSSGTGYVWVTENEDGEPTVCAYSLDSDVRGSAVPEVLSLLMASTTSITSTTWPTDPVGPLLSTNWYQTAPFNGLCPYYRYEDGTLSESRCMVGCVATAASQIMYYHKWPEALLDTLHGWSTDNYEIEDVMPGAVLDWDNMLDVYDDGYTDEEALAVQELALYCGMACKMSYGISSSGSNSTRLITPLRNTFGYKYVRIYDRLQYSPATWRQLIYYELTRGVPLLYVGYTIFVSGHAFVLDGLDSDGFCHVRWGEGGVYDGFIDMDMMNPYEDPDDPTEMGAESSVFANHYVLSFHPDSLCDFPGDTLTYEEEDIEVTDVSFSRSPDTNGIVTANVEMFNHSSDTITYSLFAFTTDSLGVDDEWDVTLIGVTALTLYPDSSATAAVRCRFTVAGSMYFGLTGDMEHVLYIDSIDVVKGGAFTLVFGPVEMIELDASHVTFEVQITNQSESGWAGDRVIYVIQEEGVERDASHWCLLNSAPGETVRDTVTFKALSPETNYTFHIRYPWEFVYSYDFTTPSADALPSAAICEEEKVTVYSLQGIKMATTTTEALAGVLEKLPRGIYITVTASGVADKVCVR